MNHRHWPQQILWIVVVGTVFVGCGRSPSSSQPNESAAGEHEVHQRQIRLAQATQEALGLTVASAELKPLEQTLQVTGQIAQDTDRLIHVNPPESGTLAKLLVKLGDRVEAGTQLALLESNKANSTIQMVAPGPGLVIGTHVTPGAPVDTLTSLMTIADLSQVWATFDLYEQDIGLVKVGQKIEAASVAYPGRAFLGVVIFISPQVDPHTRTIKVRAQIENPDYALKLGMFVTGILYVPLAKEALVVPHEAIQRIEEENVVFVQTDTEIFQSREVRLGTQTRTQAQILEGLQPGERVAAAGSFHLKAELLKGQLEESHAH